MLREYRQFAVIARKGVRSGSMFLLDELRRGTRLRNLIGMVKSRSFSITADMSHAQLLEEKAARLGDRTFLKSRDEVFSYSDMDRNANRVAGFLLSLGGGPGSGLAIIMRNSPSRLDVFFGLEKVGVYAAPVNIALRGEQLAHVIDDSDARYVGNRPSAVDYYKNPRATSDKIRDGWLYTGNLVYRSERGYPCFVGHGTESMRVKGESVSAYEVEQAILRHPDVLECAVFAVPSEPAEDEIMAAVVPVEGRTLDPSAVRSFLSDKLAGSAIPRYWRALEELPKTETHRVIKKNLQSAGITEDTFGAAKEGRGR